jgi:hypothetical protein
MMIARRSRRLRATTTTTTTTPLLVLWARAVLLLPLLPFLGSGEPLPLLPPIRCSFLSSPLSA